ncbi:MAG: hypothetical protein R2795_18270 [Saprospiraceae bacterium]
MRVGWWLWMLLISWGLHGQEAPLPDSQRVDVSYAFRDGVYSQLTDLRLNTPTIAFKNLGGQMVLQADEWLLKVETLHPLGRPDLEIPLDQVAAICVDGMPYVFAYKDSLRRFSVFAGLRVKGLLSYYAYDTLAYDTVMVRAYNPVNGRPFREKAVARPRAELTEKIIHLGTGQTWDFDPEGMAQAIADDAVLTATLKSLTEEEQLARLQKILLIYDDRHPLWLPVIKDGSN